MSSLPRDHLFIYLFSHLQYLFVHFFSIISLMLPSGNNFIPLAEKLLHMNQLNMTLESVNHLLFKRTSGVIAEASCTFVGHSKCLRCNLMLYCVIILYNFLLFFTRHVYSFYSHSVSFAFLSSCCS